MKDYIQAILAAVVTLAGLALLFLGCVYDPQGEISPSVLVAFGETATFAGAIIGIDYHYQKK